MAIERGQSSAGGAARGVKPGGILGSLKDALKAAGRDDAAVAGLGGQGDAKSAPIAAGVPSALPFAVEPGAGIRVTTPETARLSAAEAARHARIGSQPILVERQEERPSEPVEPPTTRVVRSPREAAQASLETAPAPRTQLVRGRQTFVRGTFAQDPVVGFLVVVGGPGLGASRAIFEGNNTLGRAPSNRIALDFGDETISAEAQAYIRYDATDRSFLFVPNLAKTNIVSVNDKRPAGAVELKAMDVMTFGRTQVAFLPFCGPEFDWSEISDAKDE
ncbi:MAG: FHA domain-containing protein [Hyphomicrobium sp.]